MIKVLICCAMVSIVCASAVGTDNNQPAASDVPKRNERTGDGDSTSYFASTADELRKEWPRNRTVRFVFHGHSVPAGYFKTPEIRRFDSYPHLFQQKMCEAFPTAAIDVSITAIGGENSEQGAGRFEADVLALKPEVVFIDYCLNDRQIGLERAQNAWRRMIQRCLDEGVRVVLLTPTPDSSEDTTDENSPLAQHAGQVRELAREYGIPLVDSFAAFQEIAKNGAIIGNYLSQSNHPNREGHMVVTELLTSHFMSANNNVQPIVDTEAGPPRDTSTTDK